MRCYRDAALSLSHSPSLALSYGTLPLSRVENDTLPLHVEFASLFQVCTAVEKNEILHIAV